MQAVSQKMLPLLKDLHPKNGNIPMISSVTGKLAAGTEMTASYWATNLTETVNIDYHF
jgi:acyl transferase domain-containing protein